MSSEDLEELLTYNDYFDRYGKHLCYYAAYDGRLDILEESYKRRTHNFNDSLYIAAINGHYFHILKWLRRHNCPWNEDVCAKAANVNDLEILKYLYDNKCPIGPSVFYNAAAFGDIEMLTYLHENNFPSTITLMNLAAEKGNLDNIKWLIDHDYPMHYSIYVDAARHNQLDVIKYAIEIGCQFTLTTIIPSFFNAAINGHLQILKYLHEHQHVLLKPTDGELSSHVKPSTWGINSTLMNGHNHVFHWLVLNNYCNCISFTELRLWQLKYYDSILWLEKNIPELKKSESWKFSLNCVYEVFKTLPLCPDEINIIKEFI